MIKKEKFRRIIRKRKLINCGNYIILHNLKRRNLRRKRSKKKKLRIRKIRNNYNNNLKLSF